MALGFLLFIWSVVARGRYSLSWAMPRDHALVTWGPYRYIRHPSYMGYFLMFLSLPLIMLNPVALLPLTGIPGYLSVARREEELLIQRFGEEYRDYMDRTGGFLPRIVGREAI
jgi:protein-S-isoprenylcysteine O-methyltransferase Ste14